MKANVLFRLLPLLPAQPEAALTAKEVARKFYRLSAHLDPTSSQTRNVQRYLGEMSSSDDLGPGPVTRVDAMPPRYYLRAVELSRRFMTEEMALHVLLTQVSLRNTLGRLAKFDLEPALDAAQNVVGALPAARRIRDRLRIVPDGIGRLPASIAEEVLQATVDAIAAERQLEIDYVDSQGVASSHRLTVQGLISKDGTIYLVATSELGDRPRHFALQRVRRAEVWPRPMVHRTDFDLDGYIADSHQLAHVLRGHEAPIDLRLRVAAAAIHHFRERPLTSDQVVEPDPQADGWFRVQARLANTVLLVPFLWSFGGQIEVLAPPEVRAAVARGVLHAASHYQGD